LRRAGKEKSWELGYLRREYSRMHEGQQFWKEKSLAGPDFGGGAENKAVKWNCPHPNRRL